jgi:membrane-bound lytic murein transglycosylase F
VLAAYNAGAGHVDDARHIAEKYGKNPNRWFGNVDEYVLLMSQSEYYNDSIAQHGYFRGFETYNYVNNIRARWKEYKRKVR